MLVSHDAGALCDFIRDEDGEEEEWLELGLSYTASVWEGRGIIYPKVSHDQVNGRVTRVHTL